jgi:hypothetical protein
LERLWTTETFGAFGSKKKEEEDRMQPGKRRRRESTKTRNNTHTRTTTTKEHVPSPTTNITVCILTYAAEKKIKKFPCPFHYFPTVPAVPSVHNVPKVHVA